MTRTTALAAMLLTAVLTLAACGSEETSDSGGDSVPAGAEFNDADVQFANDMIHHHEQAVQMAQMAGARAQSPQVEQLAREIEAAQGPEIDTLSRWLEEWGQDAPSDSMGHDDMGHGTPSEMPGMMNADDLARLGQAQGASWDQMFLTMMIEHHEGAIEMARTEQADGKNPDAVALAEKIQSDQTSEITQMKDMSKP